MIGDDSAGRDADRDNYRLLYRNEADFLLSNYLMNNHTKKLGAQEKINSVDQQYYGKAKH